MPLNLSFGSLPSGYELIAAPFEAPRGTTDAATGVDTSDTSYGELIEVSRGAGTRHLRHRRRQPVG